MRVVKTADKQYTHDVGHATSILANRPIPITQHGRGCTELSAAMQSAVFPPCPQGTPTEFRPEAAADFKRQLDAIDSQMMDAASEWGVLGGIPMEAFSRSGESRKSGSCMCTDRIFASWFSAQDSSEDYNMTSATNSCSVASSICCIFSVSYRVHAS